MVRVSSSGVEVFGTELVSGFGRCDVSLLRIVENGVGCVKLGLDTGLECLYGGKTS